MLAGGFLLVSATGCNRSADPTEGLTADIGADITGSLDGSNRHYCFWVLNKIVDEVMPRSSYHVWAVGPAKESAVIWGGFQLNEPGVRREAEEKLEAQPFTHGTSICPFLNQILDHNPTGKELVIIILSDGGWDDIEQAKPLIAQIAKKFKVKVAFVGPIPMVDHARNAVSDAFAPVAQASGEDRVLTFSREEFPAAFKKFRAIVRP